MAEGLCRLLDKKSKIYLVDHDRVEQHNLIRQNFYAEDLGRFKCQALAERLAVKFGREIGYQIEPISAEWQNHARVIIGCVDNATARMEIHKITNNYSWWLDAGNSHHSGQVLIGNVTRKDHLKESFLPDGMVLGLPAPSLQAPGLLIPAEVPKMDCAEAVAANEQSPVINQAMAALVLEAVRRLVAGEMDWMAAYLDLEMGTLQYSRIDPVAVARIGAIRRNLLLKES